MMHTEAFHPESNQPAAPFLLPDLPYTADGLAPHMSKETLMFHHGKHHQTYVNNLNQFITKTRYETGHTLEQIILASAGNASEQSIFNNAAQVWNHSFFWHCLHPKGGGTPGKGLHTQITKDFGSFDSFCEAFKQAALGQFGSGWAWLVWHEGALSIVKTGNADTPLVRGQVPLCTVDVWEHAYYLDFQNRRADYVTTFLTHLIHWAAIEHQFTRAVARL